jgi:hypothetical protein
MDDIAQSVRPLDLGNDLPGQEPGPLNGGPKGLSQAPPEIPYEYQYDQIPDDSVIRILTLNPGGWDDKLVGSLNFADLKENPEYEAISYVWGNPLRCREILVDGKVLPLTQSLNDALRTVRHVNQPRILWADQICINQQYTEERTQQVALMNTIYKQCKKVLVFLGIDEDEVARKAFDLVLQLYDIFRDKERRKSFTKIQRQGLDNLPVGGWKYFKTLLSQPWVSYCWNLVRQYFF